MVQRHAVERRREAWRDPRELVPFWLRGAARGAGAGGRELGVPLAAQRRRPSDRADAMDALVADLAVAAVEPLS